MTRTPTLAVERWAAETDRLSRDRRAPYEGVGWYVGLALFKALGFVTLLGLVAAFFASASSAATVHAKAERVNETTLRVRLDVTVQRGTSIYVEGCADLDGILACGNGAGERRKLRRGHSRLTVLVSNTVMQYTPPPPGTIEAWDAWAYGPGQTDVAFLYFKSTGRLAEVRPTAIAAETLTDGRQ